MTRLIDADAFKKENERLFFPYVSKTTLEELIDDAPTIDAEPVKHGKWILGKCNRCGEHAPFWSMATTYYESNFCPNCGAYMRGEE